TPRRACLAVRAARRRPRDRNETGACRSGGQRSGEAGQTGQRRERAMTDQKNTILAIVLSALVFVAWQYFFGYPQIEKQKQIAQQQQTQQKGPAPSNENKSQPQVPGAPASTAQTLTRADALAKSQRVPIDTERLGGSIALTGGRIDDLSLRKYHESVDPSSPAIVLLSPSGSPH